VEELCDHIALINKSHKIVDGETNEIRERFKQNIFEVKYKGDFGKVSNMLGAHFKVLSHTEQKNENLITVQHLGGQSNNELIKVLIPVAEILSFEEKIPGMNDVFIQAVEEANRKTAASKQASEQHVNM
jgi:ABC-2 type transport system ATP-binding protein